MCSPFRNALLFTLSFFVHLSQESRGWSGLQGLCGSTSWKIRWFELNLTVYLYPSLFSLPLSQTPTSLPIFTFGLGHTFFRVGAPPLLPNKLLLLTVSRWSLLFFFHSWLQYLTSAHTVLPMSLYSLKQLVLKEWLLLVSRPSVFTMGLWLHRNGSWRQHHLEGLWIEPGALNTSLM